jgi:hypothetical protein
MNKITATIAPIFCLIASQALAQQPAATPAPPAVVIGDSHGESIAQASGLKGLARVSVHIRGPKALEQVNRAPAQSTAFVVLGSNDAEGSIKGLDKYIDAFVAAAERKKLKLVWLGPPCTTKAWNTRVRELDEMLAARFADTPVKYVSMRDDKLCSGGFHVRDGVHFTEKGYDYMWEKARIAAGFEGPTKAPASTTVASSEPVEVNVHRKRTRHLARRAIHEAVDRATVGRTAVK